MEADLKPPDPASPTRMGLTKSDYELLIERTPRSSVDAQLSSFDRLRSTVLQGGFKNVKGIHSESLYKSRMLGATSRHASGKQVLVWAWTAHQHALVECAETLNAGALRESILEVLGEYEPEDLYLALKLSPRPEIAEAFSEDLQQELLEPASPLRMGVSVPRLEAEVRDLTRGQQELQKQLREAQEALKQAQQGQREKSRSETQLRAELDAKEKQLAKLVEEREALRSDAQSARQAAASSARTAANRAGLLKQLDAAFGAESAQAADLGDEETRWKALPSRIAALKTRLAEAQTERDELHGLTDRLRPPFNGIGVQWASVRDQFAEDVGAELAAPPAPAAGPHEPVRDWRGWLRDEEAHVLPLLQQQAASPEDAAARAARAQRLLLLRWYLLEWMKLGLADAIHEQSPLRERS